MPLFQNQDAQYLDWLDAHPNGFAVNSHQEPAPTYLVLHRSTCGKARQQNPTSTQYSKFGATTLEEAQEFAGEGTLTACQLCRPLETP